MTRKQIFILCFLLHSVAVCAQIDSTVVETDSIEIRDVALPDSIGIGVPDGKLASKEIGPAGGSIISDDGKVQLNFPEGALQAATTISIQPIINLIPNGNGKAYKFEPSGIRFSKPVEVIFYYSKEEEETCPPDLKFMALQSSNGKLEYMKYDDWDSTTRSLKGFISHFSAIIDGNQMELNTTESTVKVGQTLQLFLTIVTPPGGGDDDLPSLPPTAPNRPNRSILWSVNGGRKYGTVARQPNKYSAIYTAPNNWPGGDAKVVLKLNETTIRTVLQRTGRWRGTTRIPEARNLGQFSCNIKLYDEYKIQVTNIFPHLCGAEILDSSSFVARLFSNHVEIMNVSNSAPTLTKASKCSQFTFITAGCIGPVHVNGQQVTNYYVTGTTSPDITINFERVEVTYFKYIVKAGNIVTPVKDHKDIAFPPDLNFKASGNGQILGRSTGTVTYKVLVDPVRP